MIDAHKADGKTHAQFAGQVGLIKTDHALAAFTGAQQQNIAFTVNNSDLIRWNQRQSAPG